MRITLLVVAVVATVLVACGDDEDQPADPSVLAEIERALCEGAQETGDSTFELNGEVYDLSDCP